MFPPTPRDQLRSGKAYVSLSLSNQTSASSMRLHRLLEWNRETFVSFDVIIGDYFHRHNLEAVDGLGQSAALAQAVADGQDVARRVRAVLDSLALPDVSIKVASDFYATSSFAEHLEKFDELCAVNEQLNELIDLGTDTFLRRIAPTRIRDDSARYHCRQYQLEELALFAILSDDGYRANVYPGAHMPVMKELVAGALRGTVAAFNGLTLVELRDRSAK
jgi:tRNA-dependent cyclodipeptide synthase